MSEHTDLTQVRYEWGVAFADGSVRGKGAYTGRTAQKRATEDAAFLREKYAPDNIRVVRRAVYVGPWEEVSPGLPPEGV